MGQNTLYDYLSENPPYTHTIDEIAMDTIGKGYTAFHPRDRQNAKCYVHRLCAVAEYGFDAVREGHVHHANECKWINSPENLELTNLEDHADIHELGGDTYPQNQFDSE